MSQKQDVNGSSPIPPPPKSTKLTANDVQNKNQQTEEILNSILPPRYVIDETLWRRSVNHLNSDFLYFTVECVLS